MPEVTAAGAFGEYDLLSVIARGGMGVVYRARQRAAGRMVALKMIASPHLAGESQVRRFRAEAEAVAGLEHPHIVPLYDVGEVDGQLFFTMRLMEGGTLADLMQRDPRATKVVLLSKVARAVHHAHERGVLHRDLKPANILLDAAGEPGVADFGLALRADAGTRLTISGAAMGTPDYMAPEQASGKTNHATTAADIYSLGAILYEWLTGQPPFASPTPLETMRRAIAEEAPRPSSIHPQVDRDLETIALRCLDKDPARRYATAAALADDLDRQQRGEPIHARPVGTIERLVKWSRRRPALAALLALALIVPAGAAWFFAAYRARVESETRITERAMHERYAADIFQASRAIEMGLPQIAGPLLDGCRPAAGAADLRGFEWYHFRDRLRGDEVRILAGPDKGARRIRQAQFDPAQHRIALSDERGLVTIQCPGDETPALRWQAHGAAVPVLAWSADGTLLATGSIEEEVIRLWSVPAGAAVPDKPLREIAGRAVHVAFAPRGRQFVVGIETNGGARSLDVYDDASAAPHRLPGTAQYGRYSRDGARFLAHEVPPWPQDCPATVLDSATWQPVPGSDGQPFAISHAGHWNSLTFSGDSSLVANVFNGVDLAAWHTTPSPDDDRPCYFVPAPPPSGFAHCVKFLPPRDGPPDLAHISPPPDKELFAVGTAHGTIHLFNTENWLESFVLRGHAGPLHGLDFSSDGRWMVTSGTDGTARLWKPWRPDAPPIRLVLDDGPRFLSTDGRTIAGMNEGRLRQWDIATGTPITGAPGLALVETYECLRSARSSVDGTWSRQAAPHGAGGYFARLVRESEAAARLERFGIWLAAKLKGGALAVSPAPDGRAMAFGYLKGRIALHDPDTGAELTGFTGKLREVCRLDFGPDATWLAAADGAGQMDLWQHQAGTWRLVHSLNAGAVTGQTAFSPDGRHAVISGGQAPRAGVLVALADGTLTELRGPPFDHAAFSPDSRTLATSADKKVSLWQVPSGRFLAELSGSGGGNVQFLQFSADGRTLIHGSTPAFHLWRAGD